MKKKAFLSALGFAIAVTVFTAVYSFFSVDQEMVPAPTNPNRAPLSEKIKFKKLLENGELSLAELRGKVVLINFWASWCGPCISEMPSLAALQKKFSKDSFVVLAVNLDDDLNDAKSILKKLFKDEVPFLMVTGEGSLILKEFPMNGLPYTAVVDAQGNVRASGAGSREWDSGRWITFIRALTHSNQK